MVGPKCHVLVRTVVIFPICNFNSSYTTGFSFILVPTWLLISVSFFPTGEHASLQIYQQRLSVRNVHSALMHTKLLFPGKRSRFNERRTDANLHALQIFRPVMTKNQIHLHNHARVHIDCERVCDHWAFPSLFSKRESKHGNSYTNTTKTHSLF